MVATFHQIHHFVTTQKEKQKSQKTCLKFHLNPPFHVQTLRATQKRSETFSFLH